MPDPSDTLLRIKALCLLADDLDLHIRFAVSDRVRTLTSHDAIAYMAVHIDRVHSVMILRDDDDTTIGLSHRTSDDGGVDRWPLDMRGTQLRTLSWASDALTAIVMMMAVYESVCHATA